MATNWILSTRKYSLVSQADAIVDLFVNGAHKLRARAAMPAKRAPSAHEIPDGRRPRRRRHGRADRRASSPTPACASCCSTSRATRARGAAARRTLKPDPFFTPDARARSAPAASTRTWRRRDADWIVEAIVERLDAKQALMARVDAVRRDDAIVSSNTSGIPIASIAEGDRTASAVTGWARTSSTRRATCTCSS
jgi:hypothetical protein